MISVTIGSANAPDASAAAFDASAAQFLPRDGRPPAEGDTLRQPDLAATLSRIRDQGADGFYAGETADLIVAEMERGGGLISLDDLASYTAAWRDPVEFDYRDYTVYSMPPSSSGGVTMAEAAYVEAEAGVAEAVSVSHEVELLDVEARIKRAMGEELMMLKAEAIQLEHLVEKSRHLAEAVATEAAGFQRRASVSQELATVLLLSPSEKRKKLLSWHKYRKI